MCQTYAYFFIRSVRSLASEMPSTCAVRFCDFLSWSLIVMYSTDWAMWMPTRLVCAGCAIFSHFSFCSISLTLLLPPSLLTHTYTFPRTHLSQMLIYVHILSLSFSIIKDLVAVEQKIVYQPNLAAAMAELLMGKATNTRIHTLIKNLYTHTLDPHRCYRVYVLLTQSYGLEVVSRDLPQESRLECLWKFWGPDCDP